MPYTGTRITTPSSEAINGFVTDERSYESSPTRGEIVPPTDVVTNLDA